MASAPPGTSSPTKPPPPEEWRGDANARAPQPATVEGASARLPVDGLKRELLRKRIHLATVIVPVAVWFLPRPAAITLLAGAVVLALLVELARRKVRWVRHQFLVRTRVMLRGHERTGLSGATHMAIAYLVALLLFPRAIAVLAMLYNCLGDTAAAVVGRRWGAHRTRWGKSWEGAAAALGVNLAVGIALPEILLAAALIGAVASAALEFLPLPFDDNLRIAVGGGLAAWASTLLA